MFSDLKFAFRSLLKSPGFAVVVVLTLALGIGINTAIFSVMDAIVLQPLPYPQPQRIVAAHWEWKDHEEDGVTALEHEYWSEHSRAFEATAAVWEKPVNLSGAGEARRMSGAYVSTGFFQVLGVHPTLGRGFTPQEGGPDGPAVAVIGDGLWRSQFGGDPAAIGKSISIDDRVHTLVGVMPPGFQFGQSVGVLMSYPMGQADPSDKDENTSMIARLKSGVTLQQAQADVTRLLPQFVRDYPDHLRKATLVPKGMRLVSYRQEIVGDTGTVLWLLMGASAFVLLIACANVANLLLARAVGRKGDVAVRLALGASPGRVARESLIETWLLALGGSTVGILIALWTVPVLLSFAPPGLPRLAEVGLDYRAIGFAVAASGLTSILAGLAPALRIARLDVNETIKTSSARSSASRRDSRIRGSLVVSQVALSAILLVGAGLFMRSFLALHAVELGFNLQRMTTLQASLTSERYRTAAQTWAFEQQVLERLAALPGVTSAAAARNAPLERGLHMGARFETADGPRQTDIEVRFISARYFQTLGIPLLRGRDFGAGDTASSLPVAVVNQTLASHYLPQGAALGESIPVADQRRQVVGVVRDTRETGADRDVRPTVYLPASQVSDGFTRMLNSISFLPATWIVRTAASVDLTSAIRQAVKEADPQVPVANIRTLTQVLGASLQSHSFLLLLMGVFAGLALTLTAVGIYGTLSYQVNRRTTEMGMRMALGAQTSDVLRLVIGDGMRLALAGVALGLLAAFCLRRLIDHFLFGVGDADPLTFVTIALLLAATAFLACYLPAHRATKVDPLVALRAE